MAAICKVVVVTIILITVFPLDGVDSLDCYTCTSDKRRADMCSPNCKETNSETPKRSCSSNEKCVSLSAKSSGVMTRQCISLEGTPFGHIRPGKCESMMDFEICVCDRNLCTVGGGSGGGGGGGSGLKCYECSATKEDDSENCRRPTPKTTKTCDKGVSCVKSKSTGGGVNNVLRGCYPQRIVEDCKPRLIIEKTESVECACNKDLCNSAQYLHGTSLFVIGLIAFNVVWKII